MPSMRRFHIFIFAEWHIAPWRQSFLAADLDGAVGIARAEIPAMLDCLKRDARNYKTCGVFVCEGAGRAAYRLDLPDGTRHLTMREKYREVTARESAPTFVRKT
jgi:hypothetical protein